MKGLQSDYPFDSGNLLVDADNFVAGRHHHLKSQADVVAIFGFFFRGAVQGKQIAHLAFIPALVVVWLTNKGVCPLNNLETWLTSGRWRNPDNVEEGSFLVTIVERYLKIHPNQRTMDGITYSLMALVWLFSWAHLALMGG